MDRRRLLCVAVCIFALSHHTSALWTSPPKITKQSESYYVVLPRVPTEIECVATGTPEPTYRWEKDGVDVGFGGGFSLNGGNLAVRRPSEWTNGLYRCFASNQYGVAISNKINFIVAFTDPFRETEPETFTFVEGSMAIIPCNQPASVPVSSVFWTDDANPGNDIVLDNRVSVDPNFNLFFSNIKLSDTGNYQCNVKNDKLRIQLLSPIKEVVVTAVKNIHERPAMLVYNPPSTVQAFRTEMLHLKCIAEGYPTPTISWAKQDESLPANRMSYESYGQELVISDVTEGDAGMYTCTAENGRGAPTSATTTVIVQSTPYWVNKPEDINIVIDDGGVLNCEAEGIPLPKVTWLINSVPSADTEPNPRITITEGQGGGSVEYSNAQMEDSAVFRCVATNEHGEIAASGFVNVESIPAQMTDAPDLNVNTIEGKGFDLTCAGQGSPKPVITWIFKGSPIVMDGMKYDIIEHGNSSTTISTLTVTGVSVNDTGTYTCSIENGFGAVTGDSRVTVRRTSLPKIIKQSESYYVVLPRVPAEIECVATGTPEPTYRWEKDGVDVVIEGGFSLNGGNLAVRRPSEWTNGLYRCFASNQYGVAISNKINFTVAFTDPFRGTEPETFTFVEGSMAIIPCNQQASVPVSSVFWTDDSNPGNDIVLDNRVSVDPNFNLFFSNIKLSDTGNYQCNVKNDKLRIQLLSPIKEVVVTAVKNIHERPAMLVYNPPSTVQAFRTEMLHLKCIAEGYPTPTISWAKQDESLPANRMSYESYGQELVISDVTEGDAGMYTCTAENGRGAPTSATTTVIVQSTPYWVNKPEDINIVIYDPGELICEAGGIPLPKVTWLINGVATDDAELNPRITITEGQGGGRVEYSNAQTEDSAVFQCVATNEHGEIAASGFVNVESIPAQMTDAPDLNVNTIEGKGFDLTCAGQGSPKPVITWIFKGSPIVMDGMKYDIVERGNSLTTTSALTVTGVSVNDTGTYTCSIENGFGAVTGDSRVTVRRTLLPKIIKQSESYYVVVPRVPTEIECVATGTPEPTYRWEKDGVDVVIEGGFSLNGGNLAVRRPSEWTNGLYRCFASNQYGVAISNKINFIVAFVDPFRETEPETFTFDEGSMATIPCNQQASVPVPSVFWTDDSNLCNKIKLNNRVSVDPNFNLHFSNIELSDMGNYQCNVRNDKLRIQLLSPTKEVVVRAVKNIAKRPATLVYNPPSTVQALRTEKLRLKCMAEGYPTPTISWAKQDESLPANRMSYESDGQELVISDVTEGDAGMYTCTAENGRGAPTSATTTVIVQSTPYWVNKPEDINIVINDPGELICEAGGVPLPKVTWLVNGVPSADAVPNPRITITEGQGGGRVEYSNAQMEDSAVFRCVATNEHGEIAASGFVNVESIPVQITDASGLSFNTIEGKRIYLTCAGQGFPKPIITWIFKGSPIVMDGMKYDIVEYGNSLIITSTLTVTEVSVNDTGTYTCSIENVFWTVMDNYRVTVRKGTKIIVGPGDEVPVKKGDTAIIACKVDHDAALEVTVTWSRDVGSGWDDLDLTMPGGRFKHAKTGSDNLKILETVVEDTGTYKCKAVTDMDEAAASTQLVIHN